MYPLKQSTAITVPFFAHDVNGDAVPGLTDGGFTKRISKGSGAFAAMTVTITEMENGWYSFPLSTTHSNTLGLLTILFTHASAKQINLQFRVHARVPDDLAFPATSGRSIQVETDGMVHGDLKEWLGVAPAALVSTRVVADVGAVSGDSVAADNLEADYDGTGYAKANSTIGTTTTNTDMRGTDNAALASVLGALADAAAAGDPTASDTVVAYLKQLVNTLEGTAGIPVFPAEAAPANAVSLAEILRAIHADVTGLNGAAMRGTDSAALASVATEARLAELDAANLPADVDAILVDTGTTLETHLTDIKGATFSGATDSLEAIRDRGDAAWITATVPSAATVAAAVWDALQSSHVTAGSFGEIATEVASILADTNELQTDDVPGLIAALNDPTAAAIADAIWDELQSGHVTAGSFGELATEIAAVLVDTGTTIPGLLATLQADTDDIQTRLPAALVSGRMDSSVGALAAAAITSAAFATDALSSDALSAAAAQKIRDEILPTQNVAFSNIPFVFRAASDDVTPVTGATGISVTRSIDGGAFAPATGTVAEVGNGSYQLDASAADMNGGTIQFRIIATGGTPGAPNDVFITVVTGGGV